jgi:TRAP-type C4-dicarboxylate transport system substrate-binding protein
MEAVQLGTLDLVMTSTGPVPNFVPDVAILDIPFLFRDYAHARSTLDGAIGQEMLTKFDSKGIKALGWGENGFRHMTNSKHAVNGPGDLKGLKMRTMENPVHIQAYKGFGIIPTPMAISEVFTALQQGTVDGQENPLSVIQSCQVRPGAEAPDADRPRLLAGRDPDEQGLFDKLAAADKQIFLAATKEAIKANRARIDQDEANGVAYLRSKGMQVITDVDRTKYQEALKPVFAEFSKKFGDANIAKLQGTK